MFIGSWLIFTCKNGTAWVLLPAWEQDGDDILKQSMHRSRRQIWNGITSSSTLGKEINKEIGPTLSCKWPNVWFPVWLMLGRFSFDCFERKNISIPLMLVTTCVFSNNCTILWVQLLFTSHDYEKEKPERSGSNVRPLSSKCLLFFHDSID